MVTRLSLSLICLLGLAACGERRELAEGIPTPIQDTADTPAAIASKQVPVATPTLAQPSDPFNPEDFAKSRNGKFVVLGRKSSSFVKRLTLEGGCHVMIDFTSYSTGIPYEHSLAAQNWLENSADVEKVYAISWGFEGEKSFCAVVPDEIRRKTVVKGLNAAVAKEGKPAKGDYRKARIVIMPPPSIE